MDEITAPQVLAYMAVFGIALLITYFFFRWLFAVDKQLEQNESMIQLLKLLAKKQGVTDEDIHAATH